MDYKLVAIQVKFMKKDMFFNKWQSLISLFLDSLKYSFDNKFI